ncbi:hypothetical protein [Bradyrhizobium sp. Ec3.3]|uniref:hypothetical protein n=1 Tax=Bradyrhizobium sp. Ec3.3 TaxID=189753 RepID=UPI00047F78CE|nr:hypothetical protein [Bradyrhizobium sp. Ec3.3]
MSDQQQPNQAGYFRPTPEIAAFKMKVRELAKWFLDLLLYVAVVSILQSFARQSPGWTLKVVAQLASLALAVYLVTTLPTGSIFPLPERMAKSRTWLAVGSLIWGIAMLALIFIAGSTLSAMMEEAFQRR